MTEAQHVISLHHRFIQAMNPTVCFLVNIMSQSLPSPLLPCPLPSSCPSRKQNTPEPEVVPSPALSAADACLVQLRALTHNDSPFPNHGVATFYSFARDAGSMERSRYFGYSKDLYHMVGTLHLHCSFLLLSIRGPIYPVRVYQSFGRYIKTLH
jgi:hypothetical protein